MDLKKIIQSSGNIYQKGVLETLSSIIDFQNKQNEILEKLLEVSNRHNKTLEKLLEVSNKQLELSDKKDLNIT